MSDKMVPSLGGKMFIGGTGPLNAETGWVEIGDIESIPEYGPSFQEVNFTALATGDVEKWKGARNDGSVAVPLGRAPTDAGQAALILARENKTKNNRYNFKVELNDDPNGDASGGTPTTQKFKALVMSYTTNPGDANNVVRATANIAIITGTFVETAATT